MDEAVPHVPHLMDPEAPDLETAHDSTSQPYVGRWNQLVSNTNWEKGRIIVQWREALIAADAHAAEYSDEAWSRRVGGVSGQHAGRLRRVSERFGAVYQNYPGIFWSHFQAALDWDDAEMWLEGAVQNGWSVSSMRRTRWETLGALADQQPQDAEIIGCEVDEDFAVDSGPTDPTALAGTYAEVQGGPGLDAQPDDEADGGEVGECEAGGHPAGTEIGSDADPRETIEFVSPFAGVGQLPDDLADAFEEFKLAILRHKSASWAQISANDVLASLDALKQLVLAPQ